MGMFEQRYGRRILESLNNLNQAAAALNRQHQVAEAQELPEDMPFNNIVNFTNFENRDDGSQIQLINYLKRLGGSKNESSVVINSYWRASFTALQTTTQSLLWTPRSDHPDRVVVRKSKFYEACKTAYHAVVRAEYSEKTFDYCMKLAFKAVKNATTRRRKARDQEAAQA